MGVICFSSLKGGVGKTTLSVSIAHAYSKRSCKTVLIDLDPSAHATRFFAAELGSPRAALAQLFLSPGREHPETELSPFVVPVRPYLELIPGGEELRHFLWGSGSKVFAHALPQLIRELGTVFDHVIIDTPPEFNVLTRNAIASSDLVVVPVDPSRMSVDSLEGLVRSAQHIRGPMWSIARTMVNRKATRVNKLALAEIDNRVAARATGSLQSEDEVEEFDASFSDPEAFLELLRQTERTTESVEAVLPKEAPVVEDPIYLLDGLTYRTEEQNRLSFMNKTAFDLKRTERLSEQYLNLAKELEDLLSLKGERAFPLESEGAMASSEQDLSALTD